MTVIGALVAEGWSVIGSNLSGLTDEEYLWEPVDGCWSIRPRSTVSGDHWGSGEWVVETSFDESAAAPMTTIAWRLLHAYDCFADYTSQAFGREAQDWNEIEIPSTAEGAVALMTAAVEALRRDLESHADHVLNHGSADESGRPRWLLLDKGLLEWIHHCAEIGVLRSMYQAGDEPS